MFLQILSRLSALRFLSYPGSGSSTTPSCQSGVLIDGFLWNTHVFLLVTIILSALVLLPIVLLRKKQDAESSLHPSPLALPIGQRLYSPPGGIGRPLAVRMLHATGCQPSRSHQTSPSASGSSSVPSDEHITEIPRATCSASSPPPPPPPHRTFSQPQSTFFPIWLFWLTVLLTYVGWTLVLMRILPRYFEGLRSKARRVFILVLPKVLGSQPSLVDLFDILLQTLDPHRNHLSDPATAHTSPSAPSPTNGLPQWMLYALAIASLIAANGELPTLASATGSNIVRIVEESADSSVSEDTLVQGQGQDRGDGEENDGDDDLKDTLFFKLGFGGRIPGRRGWSPRRGRDDNGDEDRHQNGGRGADRGEAGRRHEHGHEYMSNDEENEEQEQPTTISSFSTPSPSPSFTSSSSQSSHHVVTVLESEHLALKAEIEALRAERESLNAEKEALRRVKEEREEVEREMWALREEMERVELELGALGKDMMGWEAGVGDDVGDLGHFDVDGQPDIGVKEVEEREVEVVMAEGMPSHQNSGSDLDVTNSFSRECASFHVLSARLLGAFSSSFDEEGDVDGEEWEEETDLVDEEPSIPLFPCMDIEAPDDYSLHLGDFFRNADDDEVDESLLDVDMRVNMQQWLSSFEEDDDKEDGYSIREVVGLCHGNEVKLEYSESGVNIDYGHTPPPSSYPSIILTATTTTPPPRNPTQRIQNSPPPPGPPPADPLPPLPIYHPLRWAPIPLYMQSRVYILSPKVPLPGPPPGPPPRAPLPPAPTPRHGGVPRVVRAPAPELGLPADVLTQPMQPRVESGAGVKVGVEAKMTVEADMGWVEAQLRWPELETALDRLDGFTKRGGKVEGGNEDKGQLQMKVSNSLPSPGPPPLGPLPPVPRDGYGARVVRAPVPTYGSPAVVLTPPTPPREGSEVEVEVEPKLMSTAKVQVGGGDEVGRGSSGDDEDGAGFEDLDLADLGKISECEDDTDTGTDEDKFRLGMGTGIESDLISEGETEWRPSPQAKKWWAERERKKKEREAVQLKLSRSKPKETMVDKENITPVAPRSWATGIASRFKSASSHKSSSSPAPVSSSRPSVTRLFSTRRSLTSTSSTPRSSLSSLSTRQTPLTRTSCSSPSGASACARTRTPTHSTSILSTPTSVYLSKTKPTPSHRPLPSATPLPALRERTRFSTAAIPSTRSDSPSVLPISWLRRTETTSSTSNFSPLPSTTIPRAALSRIYSPSTTRRPLAPITNTIGARATTDKARKPVESRKSLAGSAVPASMRRAWV